MLRYQFLLEEERINDDVKNSNLQFQTSWSTNALICKLTLESFWVANHLCPQWHCKRSGSHFPGAQIGRSGRSRTSRARSQHHQRPIPRAGWCNRPGLAEPFWKIGCWHVCSQRYKWTLEARRIFVPRKSSWFRRFLVLWLREFDRRQRRRGTQWYAREIFHWLSCTCKW